MTKKIEKPFKGYSDLYKIPTQPILKFSPYAWAKLLYFRDKKDTEIGGFGITSKDNPLLVEDFITVKQTTSMTSIEFDDEAVADFFDNQVDLEKQPEQFARIWLHTHPSGCSTSSGKDEETFYRAFGSCDWAIMFILPQNTSTPYAQLQFNTGPKVRISLKTEIDYSIPFLGTDVKAWEKEYNENISEQTYIASENIHSYTDRQGFHVCEDYKKFLDNNNLFEEQNPKEEESKEEDWLVPQDWWEDFEKMDSGDREFILEELEYLHLQIEEEEDQDKFCKLNEVSNE